VSSDRLRENLDAVAEAAGGVARLRELILQLAVQGKLVEQDPNDEPASVLMTKIAAELATKDNGRMPNYGDSSSVEPFHLPIGWAWARFSEVGIFGRGKSKHRPRNDPALYREGKYPFVQTGDVARAAGVITSYTQLYSELGFQQSRIWPAGTLCITIAANIAESAILGFDACFPDSVVGLEPTRSIGDTKFFSYFLQTARVRLEQFAPATAQKNINLAILDSLVVPVPPLAEQKRIVAKVDELMALCDELEQKQEQRHTVRRAAHTSALEALTNAQTPDELSHAWERLQTHWDVLASHADAVPPLRQAILQLAVQGRLVKQDSNEDPAQSIVAQWSRPSANTAGPFLLPASWQWCRVADAGEVKLGRQRSPENHQGTHMVPYLRVANVQEARLDLSDVKEMNFTPDEQLIYRLLPDDVLLNEGQSYELVGRPAIYRGEIPNACFQNTLLRFRSSPGVVPEFALIVFRSYMRSGRFRKEAQQTTNIAHLSASRLSSIEFPLPPAAEQKRIVARVDELMALCDSLEQRAREQEALASQLAHAAVAAVDCAVVG